MFLLEQNEAVMEITGLHVGDVLLHPNGEGRAHLVVSNQSGFTQVTSPGAVLGEATATNLVPAFTKQDELEITPKREVEVKIVDLKERVQERKQKLLQLVEISDLPTKLQKETLMEFLTEHHDMFSIYESDRGETRLAELKIYTGEAQPRKQVVRRMRETRSSQTAEDNAGNWCNSAL